MSDLSGALTGPDATQPNPVIRLSGTGGRAVVDGVATGPNAGIVSGGQGWQVTGVTPITSPDR